MKKFIVVSDIWVDGKTLTEDPFVAFAKGSEVEILQENKGSIVVTNGDRTEKLDEVFRKSLKKR